MGILYLSGQRPAAGTTTLAVSIATIWRHTGIRVSLVKPIASRGPNDATLFAKSFGGPNSAGFSFSGSESEQTATIEQAWEMVSALVPQCDVLIVEGPPANDEEGNPLSTSFATAQRFGVPLIGVIPYDRALEGESINQLIDCYPNNLSGIIINRTTSYGGHDASHRLAGEFGRTGTPILGTLPEDRRLVAPTVRHLADALSGTFFTGISGAQNLVEHFLVGGLITEWGGNYFNRHNNQAVFVRGGRIDIQMAALNFPLACLILTDCETPAQYVYQRAADLGVPVITTKYDTHSAISRLEELPWNDIPHDHPQRLEASIQIVEAALDLNDILSATKT